MNWIIGDLAQSDNPTNWLKTDPCTILKQGFKLEKNYFGVLVCQYYSLAFFSLLLLTGVLSSTIEASFMLFL